MNPSSSPRDNLVGLFCLLIFASPLAGATDAPTSDNAAAILAVTPRTSLPPEADDPARPQNIRWVKPSSTIRHPYWTDDVGVSDNNGNPYNAYQRSSFGTWSNFDEAKANLFPLPELLVLKNGQPVKDADDWWEKRRPEILSDYLTEIYGKIPERAPAITWEVTLVNESGGVKTKRIVGHIDNSTYPEATPTINLTLAIPVNASGPVPVMVIIPPFGGGNDPNRGAASGARSAPGGAPSTGADTERGPGGPSPLQQVLARGWGYALFDAISLQPDNNAGLTRGIIGLINQGRPRSRADEWGALTAWAWGLSRSIDYLETDKDVDAKQLGVEGHSRWGKTALWAAALDQRWAIVYASCSGEGGAKLLRRNYGETPDNIVDSFPYWMAGNFRKYGGHWSNLPVDAHELIALVAPRPVFVTGGTQDQQADPHGEFLAAVGAGPVYRLLGKNDLGTTEMPAPNVALISGAVAFREHVGPHTDALDWPVFLEYASKYLQAPAANPKKQPVAAGR
ncbi:MAG TPA: acetylxylan esterase [Opitutaceae bacterium]|nr:acetylxylan esterase [Opitutaceae bacterium]